MAGIRDILTAKPKFVTVAGQQVELARPSALDLLEALEQAKSKPDTLLAWFVFKHLREAGQPVFLSIDEVLACDAIVVQQIGREAQALYEEGRD